MSIFEKKEKNLNDLISKLEALTSTYSQSFKGADKIKIEKKIPRHAYNWNTYYSYYY